MPGCPRGLLAPFGRSPDDAGVIGPSALWRAGTRACRWRPAVRCSRGHAPCTSARSSAHRGSNAWSPSGTRGNVPAGRNKCSLYVAEMILSGGHNLPRSRIGGKYFPLAEDWASPDPLTIPCCPIVTDPQPGDVVAMGNSAGPFRPLIHSTGHVAIVIRHGVTSSVSTPAGGIVVENNWGFRPGQHPVFRRCGCSRASE